MDGNFAVATKAFLQLYIIRVPFGESDITAKYCLLKKKTEQMYERVLKAITESCHDRNLFPHPKKVIVDFESAVISAITNVLGAETSG